MLVIPLNLKILKSCKLDIKFEQMFVRKNLIE